MPLNFCKAQKSTALTLPATTEAALKKSIILYALDLKFGVQGNDLQFSAKENYFSELFKKNADADAQDFAAIERAFIGENPAYWALQAQFERLAGANSQEISITKSIKPADNNPEIAKIRAVFALLDGTENADIATFYDPTQARIKQFQGANGLAADGAIGKQTAAKLSTAIKDAKTQIAFSLDMLRSEDEKLLPISKAASFLLTKFCALAASRFCGKLDIRTSKAI